MNTRESLLSPFILAVLCGLISTNALAAAHTCSTHTGHENYTLWANWESSPAIPAINPTTYTVYEKSFINKTCETNTSLINCTNKLLHTVTVGGAASGSAKSNLMAGLIAAVGSLCQVNEKFTDSTNESIIINLNVTNNPCSAIKYKVTHQRKAGSGTVQSAEHRWECQQHNTSGYCNGPNASSGNAVGWPGSSSPSWTTLAKPQGCPECKK